jgi:general stress protein 26
MQPATSSWWSTGKHAPKSSDIEKNPDVHREYVEYATMQSTYLKYMQNTTKYTEY